MELLERVKKGECFGDLATSMFWASFPDVDVLGRTFIDMGIDIVDGQRVTNFFCGEESSQTWVLTFWMVKG